MAPETLIFMPKGDVTLILIRHVMRDVDTPSRTASKLSKDLGKVSSPLDEDDGRPEDASGQEAENPAEAEESVLYYAPEPPNASDGPFYPPPPRAARGSDASSRRDRSASPPASFWASLKRQQARLPNPIEDDDDLDDLVTEPEVLEDPEPVIISSHEVHCTCSSRHLMLASQHFQTILTGNYNEALTLRSKGHVTISVSEDFDTMVILLNIIHGASRKVPRQVTLDTLRKLATLVSSLGMLDSVEFFSDTWIDNLQREGFPKAYDKTVLPLLFVFWVFNRPDEFKNMTRITQRECNETLDEDARGVPIAHNIIDAIKRDREFAIETAITIIHALITRYMDGQTICDGALDDELRYACDAMVLGSLMKSSQKIGVWPKPEAPFNGRKFKDLAKAIRSIRILDVCNKTSSRKWNSHGPGNNCHGLEDSVEASMKSIEASLEGLELESYAKKSDDFNPPFRAFLVLPPKEEIREPVRVERTENLKVYMQPEPKIDPPMPAPVPRKEVPKFSQAEYQLPESRFSTRAEPRQVTEPIREQIMSPEPLRESPVDPRFPTRSKSVREIPTESRFQPPPPAELVREIPTESRFQPPPQAKPVREISIEPRFAQRVETRQAEEPTREQIMSPEPVKEKPRESRFLRYPEPRVVDGPRVVEQAVREERKPVERDSSQESRRSARSSRNGSRVLEELMREESKPVTREYSRESFRPEPRISPKGSVREMEEVVREEVKTAPRLYSNNPFQQQSNIQASPRVSVREVEESHQKEMKAAARSSPSPLSQEINYPVQEARIATRNSITQLPSPTNTNYSYQESTVSSRISPLPSPREVPAHEARMPARIIAKISEEPLREEVKPVPQPAREEVKPLTERKLNRTPSFPKIPKDDIKAPIMKELQTAPRVASIEEMIEDTRAPPTSAPTKYEVKPTTETKETTKQAPTTNTTEEEEMWTPQPAFKMRKSKKRFSTRF